MKPYAYQVEYMRQLEAGLRGEGRIIPSSADPLPAPAPRAARPPKLVQVLKSLPPVAIDGEGFTTEAGEDGRHLYCYMAAATSEKLVSEIYEPGGLSTKQIFGWLCQLEEALKIAYPPEQGFDWSYKARAPIFCMFSAQYDWTKWIEDLEDGAIWELLRPDQRTGSAGARDVVVGKLSDGSFFDGALNMVSTRFSIKQGRRFVDRSAGEVLPEGRSPTGRRTRSAWQRGITVWDFFRYFGRAFVPTLKDWKVGTQEERDEIQRMKDKRGEFAAIDEEEKAYCRREVKCMAVLAETLIDSCEKADLVAKSFYGPGSLAGVMLEQDNARAERPSIPLLMLDAVERAFFGGRFEVSRCGPIVPCHSYDIASAYPYAECLLPCLKHGDWKLVRGSHRKVCAAVAASRMALVHYRLPDHEAIHVADFEADDLEGRGEVPPMDRPRMSNRAWGPFAFRLENGSILFPVTSPGGWVWKPEFDAALRYPELWPNVVAREAWVLEGECDCPSPFFDSISAKYRKRLEWGKEGPGLVMKLATNSRYGKRAQSIGKAPFRCLATAGIITSSTRAMLLDAIGSAKDPWDVASTATDGILSLTELALAAPKDTKTAEAAAAATVKDKKLRLPLGAWEHKFYPGGVFSIRPGMRFAVDVEAKSSDETTTAARGLGVKVLHQHRREVLEHWEKRPREELKLQQKPVFHGAKLSVGRLLRHGRPVGGPWVYPRSKKYGKWIEPKPHEVSFAPLPKRPMIRADNRLWTWALTQDERESAPYNKGLSDALKHIQELKEAKDVADAQPDGFDSRGFGEGEGDA